MNKKQKVLTVVVMLLFLAIGILGIGTPTTELAYLYTIWFMLGVVYAGMFFVLK